MSENNNEYSIEIIEHSENLTPEQLMASLDTATMNKLSDLKNTDTVLTVIGSVMLHVHNPNPKEDGNEEYDTFVYFTDMGVYYTGSTSFNNSFKQMERNAEKLGLSNIKVMVVEKKSNNNQGSMLLAKYVA